MIIPMGKHHIDLLPEKAVWMDQLRLLCVADLHFEKDSFFASKATFLPPYGSRDTFLRLQRLIDRLRPDIVIAAGDSFHDKNAALRMSPDLIKDLNGMIDSTPQWYWLAGNHDPELGSVIHGLRRSELIFDGLAFRHQTTATHGLEISGHYHPKVRITLRRHSLSAPCFVLYKDQLILPAFGQYTGGLDINSRDFLKIAPASERNVFLVHSDEIFLVQ